MQERARWIQHCVKNYTNADLSESESVERLQARLGDGYTVNHNDDRWIVFYSNEFESFTFMVDPKSGSIESANRSNFIKGHN